MAKENSTSMAQANKAKKYVPNSPLAGKPVAHAQFATREQESLLGEERSALSVGHGRGLVSLLSSTIPIDRMATSKSRLMVGKKRLLIR